MTAEFDALSARLDADTAEHKVIFCFRPPHTSALAFGSTLEDCYLCHRPIWVAPSSKRLAAEESDGDTFLVCCCCCELHSPDDYLRAHDRGMVIHSHHWGAFARCECGLSKAEFDREVRG